MRIVKVLFLDNAPQFLPNLDSHDIKLEVVQEDVFGTRVYDAPPNVCEAVNKLTTGKEVDIVVVGNNMESGIPKSKAIADDMKNMTIVVWNAYHEGTESPYAALGFKHFGSRRDLKTIIPKLLGIAT